jgi:thioesterase domain-containing protein
VISLEIAHLLHESADTKLRVKGIVFIDSVYPSPLSLPSESRNSTYFQNISETNGDPSTLIARNIECSKAMLQAWTAPSWKRAQCQSSLSRPPPTILLRARNRGDVSKDDTSYDVDRYRDDRMLGWANYEYNSIKVVFDIDGDHYSVFEPQNVTKISQTHSKPVLMNFG